MNKLNLWSLIGFCALAMSCASAEKAPLSSEDPSQAYNSVASMAGELKSNQVDFLAHDEYRSGLGDLKEAREDTKAGTAPSAILESLSIAKAHFLKAKEVSENKKDKVNKELLDARLAASQAGLGTSELKEMMTEVDEDYRDETDNFTEAIEANQIATFQKRYLKIETKAVQNRELSAMRKVLMDARENDGDEKAPKTFKDAKTSLALAENQIQQSPRSPGQYAKGVAKANKKAKLLSDVMSKLLGEAKGSSENVALKLVYADRKIGKLSDTLNTVQTDLQSTQNNLKSTNQMLSQTEKNLKFKRAIENVRKHVAKQEAEAYQQGSKLIVRLKNIGFAVGSAELPEKAKNVIAEVTQSVAVLNPKSIEVQGNTDSQGSDELNKRLSKKRATSVAQFLNQTNPKYKITTKGLGEENPIAANDSKEGRAKNRRVDLVVDAGQAKGSGKNM